MARAYQQFLGGRDELDTERVIKAELQQLLVEHVVGPTVEQLRAENDVLVAQLNAQLAVDEQYDDAARRTKLQEGPTQQELDAMLAARK